MAIHSILIMSLINQMLRDLESRKTADDISPALQRNIHVIPTSSTSRPALIWSLLAAVMAVGIYWAYQYSQTPSKSSPLPDTDSYNKSPVPIVSYEKVLVAPNAVISDPTPEIEFKPKNTTIPAVSATQPEPAARPPAFQSRPPAQASTAMPTKPKIVEKPLNTKVPVSAKPVQINSVVAKQQADLLYHQAENDSGGYSTSHKLEQALMLDPKHLKARLLLAKTLYNQGQISKTAEFLDQSLALFPENLQFISTRAQLFLQQQNPSSALKTLQRINIVDNSNEAYLSLLAATYQQLQSYANAARTYQKLVSINPEKPENWLGLALSQEKLGNLKLSREAYQAALNKNTLKESITSFIHQRLNELR
ncbi:tetratricopeptide repeat protein [Candidatus Methylobacter oryzae]|uniref:Tetratricopeptide repeat protein n=2 Tax=Candidatus Methylobacter oryzae TaxID=2497749 RepID=A0ABY3CGP6_9GAMM|nr:tetratricopeptide repeat protein [Candidatus Methylobacter oryzae]